MKKGEIFFLRNIKVEVVEVDIQFDLTLIKIIKTQKNEYVSSKVLSKLSKLSMAENFISTRLLEGDKQWY